MRRLSTLAFRNLWIRKARTLLTMGGIMLGVAVILAVSVTTHSAQVSVRKLFEEAAGRANLVVTSDSPAERGFGEQALRRVQDTPGVAAAAPLIQTATLLVEDADQVLARDADRVSLVPFVIELQGSGLLLYGVDPDLAPQVHTVRIVEGRFFDSQTDRDRQVIILTRDYAQEKGLAVGEDVELLVADGAESFEIVGLMAKEGLGRFHRGRIGLLPLRTVQWVFERGREIDQIDVVAAPGTDTEQLKADLQATLGQRYAVNYPAARGKLVEQMIARYTQGMNLSSTLALFVGAFLIYNTFSMTVLERTRELGVLRALGATRGRILRLLLTEALLMGALGSALGVFLGLGLAYSLHDVLAASSNVEAVLLAVVAFQVPPEGLFLALGEGIVVTVLAALRPVWRASRLPPVEALHPRAAAGEGRITPRRIWMSLGVVVLASLALFLPMDKSSRVPVLYVSVLALLGGVAFLSPVLVKPLEKMLRPLIRPWGHEGLVGGTNVRRDLGRTALTSSALMMGLTMVVSFGAFSASGMVELKRYTDSFNVDLFVYAPRPLRLGLGDQLATVEGVERVMPASSIQAERVPPPGDPNGARDTLTYTAIDASWYDEAPMLFAAGQGDPQTMLDRLAQGDAVFISTVLAERYGLDKGDTIRLLTPTGEHDFLVAGVAINYAGYGYGVFGSWKDARRYFHARYANNFDLRIAPGASVQEVGQRIKERFGKRYHLQVETLEEFQGRLLAYAEETIRYMDVFVLIGLIIAALGVLNTLLVNVLERVREIGILRGLGMTRGQVVKMILAEAEVMGGIGGLLGVLLGIYLSHSFMDVSNAISGYEWGYVFPGQAIVTGLVAALLAAFLAAFYPAWRAARLDVVEAIRHE
jgi:putative ABC transport system permease protein